MEIKGKVHCLFEQSGTFKNEFVKLGIPAEDYDIQNNFGQTDHVVDLFGEIDRAYEGDPSLFDCIGADDLILAFYPCIYFCAMSQVAMYLGSVNYRKLTEEQKFVEILKRGAKREEFWSRLVRLCAVAQIRGLRMIVENPWSEQTFLKANFVKAPDVVDMDRTKRGDVFKKPTAYWFWNCEPTRLETMQQSKEKKTIQKSRQGDRSGLCSEERSMISPDYARNFIADFILGKPCGGKPQQQELF